MIFIDELRIGNWVERIGWPLKVTGMKGSDIWLDSKGYEFEHYFYDGINPIPITEEWLVRFGFEPMVGNEFAKWLDKWEGRLMFIDPSLRFYGIEENGSILFTSGNNFKYVHQLQNLYFALTGQEL
jgi:hypothetical protein